MEKEEIREREKKVHKLLLVLQDKIMSWLKSQGKFAVIIETKTKGDVLFTANSKSLFFKDYDDGSYICGTSDIYKEHILSCLLENEMKVTFIE